MASNSEILRSEFQQLIDDVTANQKRAGQYVTGSTVAQFEIKITQNGGELWGASYFGTAERGRKAGKLPQQSEFIPILMKWIQDKGLSFSNMEDLERYAKAIYWKIRRYGTSLYRKGGRTDIYTPALEAFEERLIGTLGTFYRTEVFNEIENITKK